MRRLNSFLCCFDLECGGKIIACIGAICSVIGLFMTTGGLFYRHELLPELQNPTLNENAIIWKKLNDTRETAWIFFVM